MLVQSSSAIYRLGFFSQLVLSRISPFACTPEPHPLFPFLHILFPIISTHILFALGWSLLPRSSTSRLHRRHSAQLATNGRLGRSIAAGQLRMLRRLDAIGTSLTHPVSAYSPHFLLLPLHVTLHSRRPPLPACPTSPSLFECERRFDFGLAPVFVNRHIILYSLIDWRASCFNFRRRELWIFRLGMQVLWAWPRKGGVDAACSTTPVTAARLQRERLLHRYAFTQTLTRRSSAVPWP